MTKSAHAPALRTVGENTTLLWGLTTTERNRRLAQTNGLVGEEGEPGELLANADFAFDPAWLPYLRDNPGIVITKDAVPVLANVQTRQQSEAVTAAILSEGRDLARFDLRTVPFESSPTIENKALRKRETPFLMKLDRSTVGTIERASYFGAYKGVTDILTKYLWPEWALFLTRYAARFGMTPNSVTAIGAVMCVLATFAFAWGHYWTGMALGLGFMVLDTVDGKLARCTITSSWWGNVFDHGIDLVHPPFWWWFWATGLVYWGLELDPTTFWVVQGVIQGGYVLQRAIEGVFMHRNGLMHIHVWRRFDSRFRLITARRNPNMVILFLALLFGRPDIGIIAVAFWTGASLVVHAIQLVQAEIARARRGAQLTSWLSE